MVTKNHQPYAEAGFLDTAFTGIPVQGAWFGFRSLAAGGRFLQARRRGSSRLAFFSTNFGIWEQWELVAGHLDQQPWSCMLLGFRSRRLPQASKCCRSHADVTSMPFCHIMLGHACSQQASLWHAFSTSLLEQ